MGYIPNARDFTKADPERNREVTKRDMGELQSLGMEVEVLDLRIYFGKPDELRKKIDTLGLCRLFLLRLDIPCELISGTESSTAGHDDAYRYRRHGSIRLQRFFYTLRANA
jgi:hypothetical protein